MAIPMATLCLFLTVMAVPYVAAEVHVTLSSEDIVAICDKILDLGYCLNFLKSTPGMATADLKGAGLITLDISLSQVADIEKFINILSVQSAGDPSANANYKSCLDSYGEAVRDIESAKSSLTSGDYNGANIQAAAAMGNADDCVESSVGAKLVERNNNLKKALGIVLIISNKLLGQ